VALLRDVEDLDSEEDSKKMFQIFRDLGVLFILVFLSRTEN
jgi:hypothetical protein